MDKKIRELYTLAKLTNKKFIKMINEDLDNVQKVISKSYRDKNLKIEESFFDILLLKSNNVTIKTIERLIDDERFDDTIVLKRALLERVALVFKGLDENLSLEDIERLQGYNCIKNLKRHFDIGRMYGVTSAIAHSSPSLYLDFALLNSFKRTKNSKNIKTRQLKLLLLINLCFLTEMNLAVTEFLAKEYLKKETGWRLLDNNNWHYTSRLKTKFGSLPNSLKIMYELFIEKIGKTGRNLGTSMCPEKITN